MDEAAWRLPGPAGFLEKAVDALVQGVVVLDVPPSRAGAIIPSFRRAAEEAGYASGGFFALTDDPRVPPASQIAEAALPAGGRPPTLSAASIASADGMDGVVCLVAPRPGADERLERGGRIDWRRWEPFVSGFLTARAGSRLVDPPSIVFLAPAAAGALDKRAARFRFEGVVGRDEARLVFAGAARGRGPSELDRLLAVELAVELAGWDLATVRVLAGRSLEELLDLSSHDLSVNRFSRGPLEWANGRAVSWEDGSVDLFEGRRFAALGAVLATQDAQELERRIWRAQVRALFPWLEEVRQEFIDRHSRRLRLPLLSYDGTEIDDPADLDWGQIQWAMKGSATQQEMDWLTVMKDIRNALAHRRPASFGRLAAAQRDCRRMLSGG